MHRKANEMWDHKCYFLLGVHPGREVLPLWEGCHGPRDFWKFNHLDAWEQPCPTPNLRPQCRPKQWICGLSHAAIHAGDPPLVGVSDPEAHCSD